MNLLILPSVQISPGRQRRKFDEAKLIELQDSIVRNGLLHPIVVRREGSDYFLVAGERRMRAITEAHTLGQIIRVGETFIPLNHFPCLDIGDLDAEAAYEAELEENIQRDDLTWQERAAATARLMELRTLQAKRAGAPAPKPVDISEEIHGTREGAYTTQVRNEVILARNLSNPEVAKAKTASEAFKILKHQEQRKKHEELAQKIGSTFSSADHTLLKGNCIDLLPTLPDGKFDCLLTDPPYGMGADEFGDSGGRLQGQHHYDDSYENWTRLMFDFVESLDRVMKLQAHAYVFCDIERFYELRSLFLTAGWQVFRTPLIWINPKAMRAPWPERGPQRKYQTCLYAVRGDRNALKMAPDVVTYSSDENLGHAAQKPVELLRDFLGRSCRPGDEVLDPFAGSGSIFPAAHSLKIKATGIEMNESAYGLAAKRLGGLK